MAARLAAPKGERKYQGERGHSNLLYFISTEIFASNFAV